MSRRLKSRQSSAGEPELPQAISEGSDAKDALKTLLCPTLHHYVTTTTTTTTSTMTNFSSATTTTTTTKTMISTTTTATTDDDDYYYTATTTTNTFFCFSIRCCYHRHHETDYHHRYWWHYYYCHGGWVLICHHGRSRGQFTPLHSCFSNIAACQAICPPPSTPSELSIDTGSQSHGWEIVPSVSTQQRQSKTTETTGTTTSDHYPFHSRNSSSMGATQSKEQEPRE